MRQFAKMRIALSSFPLLAALSLPVNAVGTAGPEPRAPRLLGFQPTNPAALPITALLPVHAALSQSAHPAAVWLLRALNIQDSAQTEELIVQLRASGVETLADLDQRIAVLAEESDPLLLAAAADWKGLRDRLFLIEPLHSEDDHPFSDRLTRAQETSRALAQALLDYNPRERSPEEIIRAARIAAIAGEREFFHYLDGDAVSRETVFQAHQDLQDVAARMRELAEPAPAPQDSRPPSGLRRHAVDKDSLQSNLPVPDLAGIKSLADLRSSIESAPPPPGVVGQKTRLPAGPQYKIELTENQIASVVNPQRKWRITAASLQQDSGPLIGLTTRGLPESRGVESIAEMATAGWWSFIGPGEDRWVSQFLKASDERLALTRADPGELEYATPNRTRKIRVTFKPGSLEVANIRVEYCRPNGSVERWFELQEAAPPDAAPEPGNDFLLLSKRFKVEQAHGFGPQFISGAELLDPVEETPGTTLIRMLQGRRFLFKSELDGLIPLPNSTLSPGESETPDILVYRSSPDEARSQGEVRVQISKVTPAQVFITWYMPTAGPSGQNKTVWLKEILP